MQEEVTVSNGTNTNSHEETARAGALVVEADISRRGEPMHTTGDKVWLKLSGQDTAHAWSVFESRVPAGLKLPLHVHHEQEEWYWVLEGNFIFEVGGEQHRLGAGMSVLLPRRIPHRWKKTDEADGRLLILMQPAGRMEYFFDRLSNATPDERKDMSLAKQLFAECGMELFGPPME